MNSNKKLFIINLTDIFSLGSTEQDLKKNIDTYCVNENGFILLKIRKNVVENGGFKRVKG
ncbi:hypothetical protein HZS_2526 [Henneguya salminicola]|nr:hypothetical protein HZS_2526 [Henneguya salminicola]